MTKTIRLFACASLLTMITACGGGGGGTVSTTPAALPTPPIGPAPLVGVFLDGPVAGISYRTATRSGLTSASGEFSYLPGESIVFSVGAIELPEVKAAAQVTPLDIARTSDVNHPLVTNILVFLQSLDSDADPSNGLQITATARNAATTPLDFQLPPETFRASTSLQTLLGAVSTRIEPVTVANATSHFLDTLQRINVKPIADAGKDGDVLVGTTINLDGSRSSDADGDPITYQWALISKPEGSDAVLGRPDSVNPDLTADREGSYVLSLVVNDGSASSEAARITIRATLDNVAPIARAGASQSVLEGTTVRLDGSSSSDPNGDTLSFSWSLVSRPSGSRASLSEPTSATPSFVADRSGSYGIALVVSDGQLSSTVSTTTIVAATSNLAPVANAGPSRNAYVGTTIFLDGTGSYDPNSDPLAFAWVMVSRPVGSLTTLFDSTSATPSLVPDLPGSYVIALAVGDGALVSEISTTTVVAELLPVVGPVDLLLFGGASGSEYLGCLTCNNFHPEAVCNRFGTYGNPFSFSSIWNEFGTYGNRFNIYSPWNSFSSFGPMIVGTDGLNYGRFTVNALQFDRTTIQGLRNVLNFFSSSNNLGATRTFACGN